MVAAESFAYLAFLLLHFGASLGALNHRSFLPCRRYIALTPLLNWIITLTSARSLFPWGATLLVPEIWSSKGISAFFSHYLFLPRGLCYIHPYNVLVHCKLPCAALAPHLPHARRPPRITRRTFLSCHVPCTRNPPCSLSWAVPSAFQPDLPSFPVTAFHYSGPFSSPYLFCILLLAALPHKFRAILQPCFFPCSTRSCRSRGRSVIHQSVARLV